MRALMPRLNRRTLLLLIALASASGLVPSALAPRRAGLLLEARQRQLVCLDLRDVHRWTVRLERQLRRYEAALDASPMRTQMMTAAVLAGAGDVIAQWLEGASSSFAWRRFAVLIFVNVICTPLPALNGP